MQTGAASLDKQLASLKSRSLPALDGRASAEATDDDQRTAALMHLRRHTSAKAFETLLAAASSHGSSSGSADIRSDSGTSSGRASLIAASGHSNSNSNSSQTAPLAPIGEESARPSLPQITQQLKEVHLEVRQHDQIETVHPRIRLEEMTSSTPPPPELTSSYRATSRANPGIKPGTFSHNTGQRHHASPHSQHHQQLQSQQQYQQARGHQDPMTQQFQPYWGQPSSPYSLQQQGSHPLSISSGSMQQQPIRAHTPSKPYSSNQHRHYRNPQLLTAAGWPHASQMHHIPMQEHYLASSSGVSGYAHTGSSSYPGHSLTPSAPLMSSSSAAAHHPYGDTASLSVQLRFRDAQIIKLAGTLAHYRAWSAQVQSRYQMYKSEAARPAKRVYVGGLPPDTQELELRQYANDLLITTGGSTAPGFPIDSCRLYSEKNFAFLEFRSVEEASNCMAFDGVAFRNFYLKVRRPNNYDCELCLMLGPSEPDPTMDLSGLDIVRTIVDDSPNKLFIGGLPCDWAEDQAKEVLLPFGALKAFNLVMDKVTGNSKGYCFAEFSEPSLTNYVVQSLNGKPVGSKSLTVKRAIVPSSSLSYGQFNQGDMPRPDNV